MRKTMSKRKEAVSTRGDSNGYEVGYRRPPKHSQFRPGQSGNSAGRRRGLRNLVTDVKSTLGTPVKVKEGGRMRTRSTQEVVLMVLREKALRGDGRSLDRFLEYAVRFNSDATAVGSAQVLAADDQAILDAYRAEIVTAAKPSIPAESPADPTPNSAANSGTKTTK